MRLLRTAAFALALSLACAPAFATTPAPQCVDPLWVHNKLDEDVQQYGGAILTLNGAEAQVFTDALMEAVGGSPVASVTLVMIHRVNAVADIVVFVDGCAHLRGMLPRVVFDGIYGRMS